MRKIILFFIIAIFLFICVYSYTSCVTHSRVDKSIELCNTIIESIQSGENKVDKSIEGYEKVDNVIEELKGRDELPVNLTEYFSEIINKEGFFEEVKRDKETAIYNKKKIFESSIEKTEEINHLKNLMLMK